MFFDAQKVNDLKELRYYSLFLTGDFYHSCLTLFHYTQEENKQYIIKPGRIELRLTRADQFKDEYEGKHIVAVFEETVLSLFNKGLIDQDYSDALLSAAKEFSPICEEFRHKYVLCFSKDGNCDYLKKNYACKGNKPGSIIGVFEYAIESKNAELYERFKNSSVLPQLLLRDVIYDPEPILNQFSSVICRAFQLKDQDESNYPIARKIALDWLSILCLEYKDKSFQKEKETRLILDKNMVFENDIDFIIEYEGMNKEESEKYMLLILDDCHLDEVIEVSPMT